MRGTGSEQYNFSHILHPSPLTATVPRFGAVQFLYATVSRFDAAGT